MRYRFFVDIDGTETEINPLNLKNTPLKTEREDDHVFYRTKLSGNLVIGGSGRAADFELLQAIEDSLSRCQEIGFCIRKECNGGVNDYWDGLISCNDGQWDMDKCNVELEVQPNDIYAKIFKNWDKKYNILNIYGFGSFQLDGIKVIDPDDYEFADFGNVEDYAGQPGWKTVFRAEGTFGSDNVNIAFREVTYTADGTDGPLEPLGEGWTFLEDVPGLGNKWVRVPDYELFSDDGASNEILFVPETSPTKPGDGYFHVLTYEHVNTLDIYYEVWWRPRINNATFLRGRRIVDVLKYLLDQTCPDVSPFNANDISEFFMNDTNYVTNQPNELKNITVHDITDIKKPYASEPATRFDISLEEFLDDLRTYFNVGWDIVDGVFKIEHISYWQPTTSHDLTILHPDSLVGKFKYKYNKPSLPKKEEWQIQNALSLDFKGEPIEYDSNCINLEDSNNKRVHEVKYLTADLLQIMKSPSDYSDNALVLMQEGTPIKIVNAIGEISNTSLPNANISLANIMQKYHLYGRPFDEGLLNRRQQGFVLIERHKVQDEIEIPNCCDDLDFSEYYVTQISPTGVIQTAEENLVTDSVKLIILHTIYPGGAISSGRQFDDSFDQSMR